MTSMATNKFATMLHRHTHRITLVLVYAILEWILIFLLLLNSLLSFLISKYVIFFGLKPFCTFCSRLDHVLDRSGNKNILKDLICEVHAYEISQLGYCPNKKSPNLESNREEKKESEISETKDSSCSDEENEPYANNSTELEIYDQDNNVTVDGVVDEVEEKNTNEMFEKMEIGELVSSIIMAMQDLVSVTTEEVQSPCTNSNITKAGATKEPSELQEGKKDEHRSLNCENEFQFFKAVIASSPSGQLNQSLQEMDKIGNSNSPDISIANSVNQDLNEVEGQKFTEKLSETRNCYDGSSLIEMEIGDNVMIIEKLKMELKATREALNKLYMELEEERNASAIAANQTMTMMTRLQQEKAAMKMEAQQYQRMMDEQSDYDQEALQLLNDLLVKKEKEKQELEKELQIYKKMVIDYEDHEKITVNQEDNDDFCTDTELDVEEMGIGPVKNLSLIDESLGEFEVERLSILEELKALEIKLVPLANNDEQLYEDINLSGYHTYYPQYEDTFGFVDPRENAIIVNNVSKKLLPLFDETEPMSEEKIESSSTNKIKCLDLKFRMMNKRVSIEEEIGHVYERLQGLETDRDFLKHCIGSLNKGDEGIDLLMEILQHLRDHKTIEVRAKSLCDSPLS